LPLSTLTVVNSLVTVLQLLAVHHPQE